MQQFQYIQFLYGLAILLPLVGLLFYVLKWKQKKKQLLGDKRLVNLLTKNYSHKKYKLKIVAVIVAIGLLIISAANLRKPMAAKGASTKGIDVMIMLDVSKSMLSQDEKPTRLDKAKQLIYQLTNQLAGNKVGLIVFAGEAYLQMPLTADATATRMFVSNATSDIVNLQGTVLSDALNLCKASLDVKEKKYKAAILITDGEDHDENALAATKELAETGVVLHTIGVGSIEGTPIIETGTDNYKRDINGQTIITKLNQDLLQQLSKETGGTYHRLTNTTEVSNQLINTLNSMETKIIGSAGGFVDYKSFYGIFLFVAVIILLVESFISEKKLQIN
ncbi:MAG: VWA domain-containing protein [Deinococcales bacterium]|nr:VWA domain-containing protein [Chitinophagaceae bacterium]